MFCTNTAFVLYGVVVERYAYSITCIQYNCRFCNTQARQPLVDILNNMNLIDVWRDQNKEISQYTWRRLNPLQQSRIDFVFADEDLMRTHTLRCIEIKSALFSDHSIVNFEISMNILGKVPELWRFNNSFLEDEAFVQAVRNEIKKGKCSNGVYSNIEDLGLKIEFLTSKIRAHGIRISKKRREERGEKTAGILLNR